jgi:hypothetical protein
LVWVLESEKIPKTWLTDRRQRDQKRNKSILEVTPARKYAKMEDQVLTLTESDGSHTKILLKGCTIEAVSATGLPSRKWAKRYPIKVESSKSAIYHGSRTLYMYLDTSWDKESWCKVLRLASCDDDRLKVKWSAKLRSDFQTYLTTLNSGYPSLLKPSTGDNEDAIYKVVKAENSSSKVRHFLKKLAKKASKGGFENTLASERDDRIRYTKSNSSKDSTSTNGSVKSASLGKQVIYSDEEDMATPSMSGFTRSANRFFASDDNIFGDEGTLCFNLLISRLFFDAKSSAQIKGSIQARIQRTLSNMRIPSYIGEITCTGVHTGNLPPHIRGMRVLPSDMNEGVALEIDVEYSGGALLDITTRIEVCELKLHEEDNSSSVGDDVTSDLLEDFEIFQKELKLSEATVSEAEQKDAGDSIMDEMKSGKSAVSRWKTIVNSVAKQVSQVPLSLAIKVAFLRGTLQLHIKSPPSDQLWFGFTTMPDVDFRLESAFGDRKITNGHVACYLINRFKAAIRDTMVLPNCECIGIPWMLAEKDDWVPREVAPFIWINKEHVVDPSTVPEKPTHVQEVGKETTAKNQAEGKSNKAKKLEFMDQPKAESVGPSNQELTIPLLKIEEPELENPENQSTSRSLVLGDEQDNNYSNSNIEGDDLRPRKIGTRARMLGLGKKMGEKLEEKRRHLEEKGKVMVERMRDKPENR